MSNSQLEDLLKDVALDTSLSKMSNRQVITPISEQEKLEKCTCSHLKRYHILAGNILICKYNNCKCKGYKVRIK